MATEDHSEIMMQLGKLVAGVDGINNRLDKVNGRLEKHDNQIQTLREENAKEDGRDSALNFGGKVIAGAIGLLAGLAGSFIQSGMKL